MSKVIIDKNTKIENWGLNYNRKTHNYERDKSEILSEKELKKEKRKISKLIEKLEIEAQKEYKLTHSKGYCPRCHCLLPLNGLCDLCD